MEVKHIINITARSNSVESGPPIGTILGNIGVNAIKFAKEFNEFTQDLPIYFKLKVKINIYKNNSFSFNVFLPTIGYILSVLRKDDFYFDFLDLLKLALFKFPNIPLQKSIYIVLGTVFVSNTKIKFINII
jgi:hypothetical protein